AMNAWMSVPLEAASKHSNGGMIWPPGNTSMWNRPSLISSTIFAIRSAVVCTSSALGQAVDMRHWTFGWAITLGASTAAAAPTATRAPPVFTMNRRRSMEALLLHRARRVRFTETWLPRYELVVGAFGHVIPGADQRLELREGGVHLPGHRRLLGLLVDE